MTDTTMQRRLDQPARVATAGLELVTPDPAEAIAFYSWLFAVDGRGADSDDGGDALVNRGIVRVTSTDETIGGPGWIPQFHVADVATTLRRAEAHGFGLGPTLEVGGRRTHYVLDRHGVRSALVQATEPTPATAGTTKFVCDYWAIDVQETLADFAALLDTEVIEVVEDPLNYHLLHVADRAVMGVLEYGGGSDLPNWFPYLRVDDVERSIRFALAAGCRLRVPLSLTPVDRSAVLEDPFGTLFCLSTVLRPDEAGRRPHPDGRRALTRIRSILR